MTRGFDKVEYQQGMDLFLQMVEGTGTLTQDWSKGAMQDPTLTGAPTWTQLGNGRNLLSFDDGNPDFIEIAAAESTDMDYTVEDFTLAIWFYADSIALRDLINRGLDNTDGYELNITALGAIEFTTKQAATQQTTDTADGEIVAGQWYFVVITRSGANVRIYINGHDRTATEGVHVNPTTSNRKLLVGVYNDEASRPFDGRIWGVRAWVRALTDEDVLDLFTLEKHWFGVV